MSAHLHVFLTALVAAWTIESVHVNAAVPVAATDKVSDDATASALRIGVFNIQVFGRAKMSKPHVVKVLVETVARYDLMFFMEIRDITGTAIKAFMTQLNAHVLESEKYDLVISERLGRTSSKEQYAYLYKVKQFEVSTIFQESDPQDKLERPPYGAKFRVKEAGSNEISEFGILGIHTSPTSSFGELQELYRVFQKVKSAWKMEDILVVGDFNSDCSYISWRKFRDLELRRDSNLRWLVNYCHMTTMVSTKCLYDHVVVSGKRLQDAIQPGSARVHFFDEDFSLNESEANEVSDHYPVEFKLVTASRKSDNFKKGGWTDEFKITRNIFKKLKALYNKVEKEEIDFKKDVASSSVYWKLKTSKPRQSEIVGEGPSVREVIQDLQRRLDVTGRLKLKVQTGDDKENIPGRVSLTCGSSIGNYCRLVVVYM